MAAVGAGDGFAVASLSLPLAMVAAFAVAAPQRALQLWVGRSAAAWGQALPGLVVRLVAVRATLQGGLMALPPGLQALAAAGLS